MTQPGWSALDIVLAGERIETLERYRSARAALAPTGGTGARVVVVIADAVDDVERAVPGRTAIGWITQWSAAELVRAWQAGVRGFIAGDTAPAELARCVRAVIGGTAVVPPECVGPLLELASTAVFPTTDRS
jgi:DNA-binding NarL/FixJ family response regulator